MSNESQMTTLILKRAKAFSGQARRYEVLLDNQFLTHLKNGETQSLEIPAGSHRMKVRVFPVAQSQEISLELEANKNAAFEICLTVNLDSYNNPLAYVAAVLLAVGGYMHFPDFGLVSGELLFLGLPVVSCMLGVLWSDYRSCKGVIIKSIEPEP